MRAAKVQASLRICAVSPEPPLLAHTSSESRGTFRQKARSLASLNGWACAVKICHDGMLEDTNSLDAPQMFFYRKGDNYNKLPLFCSLLASVNYQQKCHHHLQLLSSLLRNKKRRAILLKNEPSHEIMALFVLRKLILQTCMCSHPVRLDV